MRPAPLLFASLISALALGQPQLSEEDRPRELVEVQSRALDEIQQSIEAIAVNTSRDDSSEQLERRQLEIDRGLVRSDLVAQQSVAESTWWIMLFSGIALALSSAGLWMLWRTVYYTKHAARSATRTLEIAEDTLVEARKTTKAAQDGADASKEMIKQDRAWVCTEDNPSIDHKIHPEYYLTLGMAVDFALKNVGKTPAFQVRAGSLIKRVISDADRIDTLEKTRARSASILGPEQHIFTTVSMKNEAAVNAVAAVPHHIYICCEYTTVYGEIYLFEETLEFALREGAPNIPRRFEHRFDVTGECNRISKVGTCPPPC